MITRLCEYFSRADLSPGLG